MNLFDALPATRDFLVWLSGVVTGVIAVVAKEIVTRQFDRVRLKIRVENRPVRAKWVSDKSGGGWYDGHSLDPQLLVTNLSTKNKARIERVELAPAARWGSRGAVLKLDHGIKAGPQPFGEGDFGDHQSRPGRLRASPRI